MGTLIRPGGVDTPDSNPNVAEEALKKAGIDAEVINASVGGYSLHQERLYFEETLFLSPDMVVFIIYVGNDYKDILIQASPHLSVKKNGEVTTHSPVADRPKTWLDRLQQRSRALGRARATWKTSHNEEVVLTPLRQIAKMSHGVVWKSMDQVDYFQRYPERVDISSAAHKHEIQEIARIAAEHDIECHFVILPSKYQIKPESDAAALELGEELLGLYPEDKFEDRVRKEIRTILNDQGVSYLDPDDDLIQRDMQLYWTKGHHLNVEGCAIVGELIAKDLVRTKFSVDIQAPTRSYIPKN